MEIQDIHGTHAPAEEPSTASKRTDRYDFILTLVNLGPPHIIAGGWPTVKSAVDKISSFLSISAAKISHEKRILEHLPLGMAPAYSRKLRNKNLKYSSCRIVISAGESANTSAELDDGLAGSKLPIRLQGFKLSQPSVQIFAVRSRSNQCPVDISEVNACLREPSAAVVLTEYFIRAGVRGEIR